MSKTKQKLNKGKATRSRKGKPDKREEIESSDKRGVGSNKASSADNDASWYANNEYLLRDAASLAFSNPAGIPVSWRSAKMSDTVNPKFSFPGIWTLQIAPSVGTPSSAADAVNVAARNIYSYVRHANSGHANYDAPNMMLYLLAMDSLYSAYSWLARAYGLIRTFSQKNRYIPIPLFQAMNLDYEDFLYNQVNFRFWLNTVAERIGSLCVPASMTYMMRHMWMFQNVFVDNLGLKAQMYVYNPEYFLQYVPVCTGLADVPGLKNVLPTFSNNAKLKFADVARAVDGMIEAVMSEEDLNIMSGDILKAFGESGVWKLVPIHEDYDISAVYSEEVLHQIHNATSCDKANYVAAHSSETQTCYKIYEYVDSVNAVSYIKESPLKGGSLSPLGMILDMHTDTPTPELTMVATRLMAGSEDTEITNTNLFYSRPLKFTGSDVVTGWKITYADVDNDGQYITQGLSSVYVWSTSSTWSEFQHDIDRMAKAACFAMHPTITRIQLNQISGTSPAKYGVKITDVLNDLDNYTLITNEELSKMHETALLSEFNVPLMGSWAHKLY